MSSGGQEFVLWIDSFASIADPVGNQAFAVNQIATDIARPVPDRHTRLAKRSPRRS